MDALKKLTWIFFLSPLKFWINWCRSDRRTWWVSLSRVLTRTGESVVILVVTCRQVELKKQPSPLETPLCLIVAHFAVSRNNNWSNPSDECCLDYVVMELTGCGSRSFGWFLEGTTRLLLFTIVTLFCPFWGALKADKIMWFSHFSDVGENKSFQPAEVLLPWL